ncbi:MAG: bifunctional sugar-1-phosphate nucleotidylyltransferase/acetyltransferase [Candidatus Aenigmatarchaeota archaeon]
MQTVVLAAGTGKRVFPLAVNKPKPMFKIVGKPLLEHVIETLKESSLTDFIIVVGHNAEQIKDYFGDGKKFSVRIRYAYQKEALGMANALQSAEDMINDDFFVVNADDVFESMLIKEMMKEHRQGEITLSCKPVEETWKFGIIKTEDYRVTKFVEKPAKGEEPSNLAVIGVYILTKKIFDYYKKIPVSDKQYEDAVQAFIDDGGIVRAVSYDGFFSAYKYPWDLFTIDKFLMKGKSAINSKIPSSAVVDGNCIIDSGVRIMENACIRNSYIGKNVVIGNNALILDSSIGDNSVIGFSTEIKNSIIGERCWFHQNYIGDSIISDNCSFGAGTVTANLRFDEKTINVRIEGKEIDSGLNKFGAIVADGCRTGINSSTMPGVKIGPNSIIGPNVCLTEDLEPNKMILVDKKSYSLKENPIETKDRRELMERLLRYKK